VEPNDPHALAALGDHFYFQEDWEKAREHYGKALAQRRFAQALFGLGMVELKNKNYAAAAGPLAEAAGHLQQGDVETVRTILDHMADLIEDEGIAKGANNNGEWFFLAGEETVYLSNLPAKRAYVHGSRAAILYVVGEEESAEHAARLIPKLSAGDSTGVTRLIGYDLTLLVQRRGDLDARAQRFPGWWESRLGGRR
jgi:hypothetical protein